MVRNRLRIILGQLARVFAGLVLLDTVLWLVAPVPNVGPNPPYYIDYEQDLPGLQPNITYTQNIYGFRSETMKSKAKPDDTIRVICVGASTTEQVTQSTPDMWCSKLAGQLVVEDGTRLETAAYGCSGSRALDVLFWVRDTLPRYQPDIVITLLGINDLAFNGGPGYEYRDLESATPTACARHRGFDFKPIFFFDSWTMARELSQIARRIELVRLNRARATDESAGRVVEWHSDNLPSLRQSRKTFRKVWLRLAPRLKTKKTAASGRIPVCTSMRRGRREM
jgi:hypothetical protein